ncbi:MAG: S8 family serine peptidase [Rhodospirillales bacterium]|nr:S8 family serine peptidase [Rhodospirillales bacterium]
MRAIVFISGFIAIGIVLLAFAFPARAAVKVLEYNPDGTVKGIKAIKKEKAKNAPENSTGSAGTNSKKFSPAALYVEGELIVVNPSRHFEVNARPLGFSILEKSKYSSLGITVFRLRTPAKFNVSEAKTYLSRKFPRLNVDANHTFDITGTPTSETVENHQLASFTTAPAGCGKGIRIGMIDGGVIVKHPALAGQKIKYRRFNTKGVKSGPSDHGTAIAAMFVGKQPKQGLGGLLPSAEVRAANVQEVGPSGKILARASNILNAIDWLISEKVHVINFNIAGADNQALRVAVERAQRKDVIMVAAVGNWGQEVEDAFPAAYPPVIAVTATDKNKQIYPRANKGPYVEFAAKGVRVWAASNGSGGNYVSGTSFATPMVASLIAMEKARNKKSDPNSIRTHLKGLTVDLGSSGKDKVYGWGFIDKPSLCK